MSIDSLAHSEKMEISETIPTNKKSRESICKPEHRVIVKEFRNEMS